jgi:ADP-ribose pyrophosphatase YjhB (NUDIX family)
MEKQLLNLFLFNRRLKFNEIEKNLKIRSNKLAYHLKNLIKQGILFKDGDFYSLSDASEYLIPYISEKNSVLPVVLVGIGNDKKAFLYKREKRPYQGYLSLPGGRITLGESIPQAAKRIMREKFNVNINFRKINSISLEHIRKDGRIIHSFLLVFVSASTKDKLEYTDVMLNKERIISTDRRLLNLDLKSVAKIRQIFSRD